MKIEHWITFTLTALKIAQTLWETVSKLISG